MKNRSSRKHTWPRLAGLLFLLAIGLLIPKLVLAQNLPPMSYFIPLPSQSPGPFLLRWAGVDQDITGVQTYDVEFSEAPNGPWTPLLTQSPATSVEFPGIGGHTYYFRIRARDNAGNIEAWRAGYQATTTVEALPPIATFISMPAYGRGNITILWQGTDPGGSGIKGYDLQYRVGSSSAWISLVSGALRTDVKAYGNAGETLHFRVRATDYAQNVGPWYGDTAKTQTTFFAWAIFGYVHDNSGAPVRNAQVLTNPALLSNFASNYSGFFIAYANQSALPFSTTWSKVGYGSPPITGFRPDVDAQLDVTLPPQDNRMVGGNFESDNNLPGDWQTSGIIPASISHSQPHTGTSAALLGVPYWGDLEIPATAVAADPAKFSGSQTRTVVDSQGTVHLIWTGVNANSDIRIQYASKAPGGGWSPPLDLSGPGIQGVPDLAVDSLDNLHVVWAANGTWYTTRPSGGAWSTPVLISPTALGELGITAGPDGMVHVVGDYSDGIGYTVCSAGQWAPLSLAAAGGHSPTIKVDHTGTLHLLWKSFENGKQYFVNYSSMPAGGAWSASERVSSGPSNVFPADLSLADDDTLHAVWETTGAQAQIEYRSKTPGAGWGTPVLFNAGSSVYDLKIAATPEKVMIVFGKKTLSSNYVYGYLEKRPGSNWSDPINFPSPSRVNYLYGTSLAAGPDGVLHLAWFEWAYRNYGTPNPIGEIHYLKSSPFPQTGEARLSQTLSIPEGAAPTTLAFYYQLGGGSAANQTGFSVQVLTPDGATNLLTTQTDTMLGWTFQSLDLSPWHGQTVTLVFRVNQAAGYLQPWALIDDVSVGSTYPDVWAIMMAAPRGNTGSEVTYDLRCGNLGGAAASQVQMEVTLPPDVTFVRADPAPASLTPRLTWDMGSLAPQSEACSIHLTVKIAFQLSAALPLTTQIKVSTASTELELENNSLTVTLPIRYAFRLPILGK